VHMAAVVVVLIEGRHLAFVNISNKEKAEKIIFFVMKKCLEGFDSNNRSFRFSGFRFLVFDRNVNHRVDTP
jgi:hypothetical protein